MSSRITPSILSRPQYGTLSVVAAKAHLLIADDEGGAALLQLIENADSDFLDNAEIIYVATPNGAEDHSAALQAVARNSVYVGPSIAAAISRVRRSIERTRMGTQLYLAGSETLMGLAMQAGMEAGLDFQGMQTEHRGTLARRVQCVHCKGVTEEVTTQPVNCAHCGLLLLVRDHYSRRLAAFQGVNINAEDPSDVPEKEEIFR